MTTSDKPAPDHLPPTDIRVMSIRRDSIKGFDELTIEAASFLPVPSLPVLKAQIEAAPAMADLLRWFVDMAPTRPMHPKVAQALALLDSIDAARKAGG